MGEPEYVSSNIDRACFWIVDGHAKHRVEP